MRVPFLSYLGLQPHAADHDATADPAGSAIGSPVQLPVRHSRFLLLFLFLLAYLILYPLLRQSTLPSYWFRGFTLVVTLLTVYAASYRRTLIVLALLLAIPAWLRHSVFTVQPVGVVSTVSLLLGIVFDVFIVVAIFRRVFTKDEADADTILGALCVYLLIGFAFTNLFLLLALLQPHAFLLDPVMNLHAAPDRLDLLYYSFGTMTCLGASGIAPISAEARSLTTLEAILGVLYLAVLVARLVGAYRLPVRD